MLSTFSSMAQTTTSCDSIELSDRTVYIIRGEHDSQIEVAKKKANGQKVDTPLYIDKVWTRGGSRWDRSRTSTIHKNDGKPIIYRQFVDKVSYHFVSSLAWNGFTAPEWRSKTRFWPSFKAELGFYGILPIGRSPWAFNAGLSLARSNFTFDKKYCMLRDHEGKTTLLEEPTGVGYAWSMLDILTLELPVGLSLSWGETNAWSSLSVVPKIVCLQKSRTLSLDERVSTLVDKDLNVRPFGLDLRAEIGYSFIGIFGRISMLSTIPAELAEVGTRDYSVGVVFRL